MTQRLRRILIMIVMALLTVTLMTASLLCSVTYARYAGGKFNEEKSIYDQIIEFVGANQYEVYSPEELVEAIENGYSYIKIGKGAEEPFVITTGVTDVTANLVIDLNGTTIVRNSRNPVLDVQRNVSAVLVYDSTVENDPNAQPGSFYNPVGSALQVSGGTLTVAAGRYDSGPKDGIATSLPSDTSDIISVTVHSRTSRTTQDGYSVSASASMPALSADVYIPEGTSSGYNYIEGDTYLIYSKEQNCYESGDSLIVNVVDGVGDALAVPCNAASCDFYYYYQIDAGDADNDYDQTYAVIYGYNDVKGLAEDEDDNNDGIGEATALIDDGLVWPYAAVRSIRSTETVQEGEGRTTGGEGFMRGGAFSTYFGTENTYGIYAEGGTLSVADGVSFTAVGEGVCIRSQTSSTTTDSNAAASLEISGGTFSSELGDTIQMEGGSVTITGGTFEKNASSASSESTDNGSAIDIQGGSLKVNEKDTTAAATKSVIFNVTGNYVNGIKMTKTKTGTQSDVISNATFNFNPLQQGADSSLAGGSSVAAIQVAGGSLEVSDSNFNFNKGVASNAVLSRNNGIYVHDSEEGKVSGSVTATGCTFTFGNDSNSSVTASAGIASVGGEVTATNCTFTLPGYSNYGIYATGGETTVTGGSITMTGRGMTQIGSGENAARGNDNFGINISGGEVTANGCTITITGTYSAGVLARGGTVNLGSIKDDVKTIQTTIYIYLSSVENETITTLSSSAVSSESVTNTDNSVTEGIINITGDITIDSNSLGITARGTVNVNSGVAKVKTLRATGVYVNNGTLNVKAGATLDVTSTIAQGCTWVQPPEGQTEIPPSIYNGVYVNGGSLNSTGTLNVTFTGVDNDPYAAAIFDREIGLGEQEVSEKEYSALKTLEDAQERGASYQNFQVKSYAVRVEATTTTSSVTIVAGTITNDVGGGVLVNGGTVELGNKNNAEDTALSVQTTGVQLYTHYVESMRISEGSFWNGYEDTYYVTLISDVPIDGADPNWAYVEPRTGGDAVKVVDGTLEIYSGTYSAAHGNGILVSNGTATVNGGTFTGTDNRRYGTGLYTGAGSNYGLKVLGGSATVKGGSFTANGGGVFIMGENASTPQTQIISANINVSGATGVSVWNYANVVFGGTESTGLTITAESTGLAVEKTSDGAEQIITINSGTFTGETVASNKNGIWYGNDATMTINGGIFTGGSSGLFIGVDPGSNKVKISAGTFTGNSGAISGNNLWSISTNEIIASGKVCYYNNAALYDSNTHANRVGGPNYADVNLNAQVYYNSDQQSAFNTLGTIVVQ